MENKNAYQRKSETYSPEVIDALDETMGENEVTLNFEYNLEGKKAGYFDVVVYNINALLKRHYAQKGVEGRDIWSKAYRHTVLIAGSMSSVPVETDEYGMAGISVLNYLMALAKAKKFAKIKLTNDFDVQFFDRNGNVLFEFNPKSLRKDQVLRTAKSELEEKQEQYARIIQTSEKKEPTAEAAPSFIPLVPPQISEVGQRTDFSLLETVRLTGKAPRIIEEQFRDMDLCSGYAVGLLIQEYGKDAVAKAGLVYYGKIMDAWNIKESGLRNDGLSVAASMLDTLVQRRSGKMDIPDRNAYYDKLGNFYKSADDGTYPSLITAFQKNTRYTKQILEENKGRTEKTKSMNSHVLVCLGRGPVNKDTVKGRTSLRYFLRSVPNVAYGLQKYLKVKVQKKNGDRIEVHEDGLATIYKADGKATEKIPLKDINLVFGDEVEWQDVLVTDFYKGEERVMGLATYATSRNNVLMENFVLKNVPTRQRQGKYRAIDFVQIENSGVPVGEQLKMKLGLSANDLAYYLTALADSGVDLSRVAEKDLIPVFNMNDVRQKIDAGGGPARVQHRIVMKNIERHNKGSLEDIFVEIKPGQTPWETVKNLFGDYFEGSYALTDEEQSFVLRAIDESCPNIDLHSVPPKFEAGGTLYLTWKRIFEIARRVRERQAESFSGDDYVKIVREGDSPYAFIRDCFDIEVREMQVDLHYSMLDSLERSYLLKALQACSAGFDPAKFKAGSRLVMRRDDLQKCVKDIEKKRELQVAVKQPAINIKKAKEDIEAAAYAKKMGLSDIDDSPYLKTVVPPSIADRINEIYPGKSLKEVLVRNILYFIFVNEQSRGGIRARVKKALSNFEEVPPLFPSFEQPAKRKYLISSIGPFQVRPAQKDLIACKDLFKKFGIKLPENFDEFRSMIKEDVNVSAIVAGQRILESLNSFENFIKTAGEDNIDLLDENLTLMVATSYNRSPEAIYRAVFQNWAINLAAVCGVKSDVETGEVDALLGESGKREMLETHVIDTFRRVAEKLAAEGKIKFAGNPDGELQKIRSNKLAFVRGPLFQELQRWHKEKTGTGLRFVFNKTELERGKGIFSYGARLFSMPDQWANVFKDYGALHSLVGKMKEDYKPEPYAHPPMLISSPLDRIGVEKKQKLEKMLKESGISECYTRGQDLLTVYDRAVKLRISPRGETITSLYFGTVLKVEGIQQKGDEVWLKIRVAEGEKEGLEGYVSFRKDWFSNENAPTITPRLTSRLKKLEENSQKPLPKDYIGAMNAYLRFLHNYNPEEPPKSAEMMKRSRATAFEVRDRQSIDAVTAAAKTYGYIGQRFFAILPKKGGDYLNNQSLYVIDTANKRVISFLVSTGRPDEKTETPSGMYTASGAGFRALNYFGSHQGTYLQKYKDHRVSQFQGTLEKYKRGPVAASMTTGLIPIQQHGEIVESAGRYFHGTNRENHLGSKASGGCVRMSNMDIVYLASLLNGSTMDFQIIEDRVKTEIALPPGIEVADASQVVQAQAGGKYRKTIRR